MGYALQALVTADATVQNADSMPPGIEWRELECGFVMLPMTEDLLTFLRGEEEETREFPLEGFWKLSPQAYQLALSLSAKGPVAYMEAEFFGGVGGQSGVVWNAQNIILGPIHTTDGDDSKNVTAINQVLRAVGVEREAEQDEFVLMRLDRHANTQDWADEDPEYPSDEPW